MLQKRLFLEREKRKETVLGRKPRTVATKNDVDFSEKRAVVVVLKINIRGLNF
jgi:hypothetical protein